MLEHLLKDYHQYVWRIRQKTLSGKRGKDCNDEHRQIMEAIRDKDADRAEEIANRHMRSAYDNMVNNGLLEMFEKA